MMALHWYNLLDQAFVHRLVISHWCLIKEIAKKYLKDVDVNKFNSQYS